MGKGVPCGLGGLWEQADSQKAAAKAAKQYWECLDMIFLSKNKTPCGQTRRWVKKWIKTAIGG